MSAAVGWAEQAIELRWYTKRELTDLVPNGVEILVVIRTHATGDPENESAEVIATFYIGPGIRMGDDHDLRIVISGRRGGGTLDHVGEGR